MAVCSSGGASSAGSCKVIQATRAPLAFHGQIAPHQVGQLPGQSQTDTRPAFGGDIVPAGLEIPVEEVRQILQRDAAAAVRYFDPQLVRFPAQTYPDGSAVRRKLERIGEEVIDDLLQSLTINEEISVFFQFRMKTTINIFRPAPDS